jgi:hypothetical protein
MVPGGIARRISFCLDDPSAEAPSRQIVHHNLPDQRARQLDRISGQFGAAEAPNGEFHRRVV